MKRVPVRSWSGLFVLTAGLLLAGCGGTETGNPAGYPDAPYVHYASELVDSMCVKLTECFDQLSLSDCRSQVEADPALPVLFGVQSLIPLTLVDLLFEPDLLQADPGALNQCLSSIENLDCRDPGIEAVRFTNGSMENLERMIPDEGCPEVFSGTVGHLRLSGDG